MSENVARPKRFSSRYYGRVRLREAMEQIVADYVAKPEGASSRQKVVDLGCGVMPYRYLFEPYVGQYIGVDLADNERAEVHLHAPDAPADLPDHCADYVLSTQVLEHVESPAKYLAEARRLCKDDGYLFLSTHGMFKYHPHPTDYWRWTAAGLRKQLEQSGWKVEKTIGILGFAAAACVLFQDAIVTKLPRIRKLRAFVAAIMQQFVGLFDLLYTEENRQENAAIYLVIARPITSERAS